MLLLILPGQNTHSLGEYMVARRHTLLLYLWAKHGPAHRESVYNRTL